jgi:hypothetical protein
MFVHSQYLIVFVAAVAYHTAPFRTLPPVDLMLETKLESLVTPNLLFFAARDDSTFDHCLWNGLIGA